MAQPKKKGTRRRWKPRLVEVLGPPTDSRLIVDLLQEMHHIVLNTPSRKRHAMNRCGRALDVFKADDHIG